MRPIGPKHRLLPHVLRAIADLKESNGSTTKRIVDQVENIISAMKLSPKPRNLAMQVRRAIKHGINKGMLKQRSGKFRLGLNPKDFAIYRTFRNSIDPLNDCYDCRRGKRRSRKKRRSRRRRRSYRRHLKDYNVDSPVYTEDSASESMLSRSKTGTPEPVDKARGRRRRKRKSRRSRRRRRRSYHLESDNQDNANNASGGEAQSTKSRGRFDNDDKNYDDAPHAGNECDNPECLCQLNKDGEGSKGVSREGGFRDSYLN